MHQVTSLLKQHLRVLEQILLLRLHLLVVTIRICVFQDLSALDNLLNSFIQELQLHLGIVLLLVKQHYFVRDYRNEFLGQLL